MSYFWKPNLKPCPFCGQPAHFRSIQDEDGGISPKYYSVACSTQSCFGSESHVWFLLEEEAEVAWNKRSA